jgi:outer membrane protein TolC
LYQGLLGASWQLDLFGCVRRLSEAAQVYASEQGQRGVALAVVSAVASSYIGLRALDRQLEIAQATAANFGETARIFELRFRAGAVSQTEVVQIRSQYLQALAAIPAFQQQIAAQENLISILLGRNPGPIARGKTIDQLVAPLIPADLPSALLQRRPDILQAERVTALREFARLSKLKFDKGVAGYLEVLAAENELFAAELASVRLLADRYIQVVNVYQAMGGGWVTLAESIAVPPRGEAAAKPVAR